MGLCQLLLFLQPCFVVFKNTTLWNPLVPTEGIKYQKFINVIWLASKSMQLLVNKCCRLFFQYVLKYLRSCLQEAVSGLAKCERQKCHTFCSSHCNAQNTSLLCPSLHFLLSETKRNVNLSVQWIYFLTFNNPSPTLKISNVHLRSATRRK